MARILVGCSGFTYASWRGSFYPRGLPQRTWLDHYMARFPTVEINGTFYRFPTAETLDDWRSRAPEGFEITLKAHRQITHRYHVARATETIDRFYRLADRLGDRLGCILFQVPPTVEFDLEWLDAALAELDPRYRNALELRHSSWWRPEVVERLRKAGVAFVSVSAPPSLKLPEELVVSAPFVYLRFHGTSGLYDHAYTPRQLTAWADRIALACARPDVEAVYAYFNNDVAARAPFDALELTRLLAERGLIPAHAEGRPGADDSHF